MSALYTTQAVAVGGRAGSVRSLDGLFSAKLALPASLGGKGGATNPEQLFASGYAACFGNAVIHVARAQKLPVKDDDVQVTAEVSLNPNGSGGFQLAVSLVVEVLGIDQATAEKLVETAHSVCPYSNAVRGNIDVQLQVRSGLVG
jgi:osmotically inducible protein OsmC